MFQKVRIIPDKNVIQDTENFAFKAEKPQSVNTKGYRQNDKNMPVRNWIIPSFQNVKQRVILMFRDCTERFDEKFALAGRDIYPAALLNFTPRFLQYAAGNHSQRA